MAEIIYKQLLDFLGEPEIGYLGPAIVQENIGGLQVSMHDIIMGQVKQSIIHVPDDGVGLILVEYSFHFEFVF